ncbi:uncharacterized protein LOC107865728 isoform X2 [Capsicum annuum]|uniref:uncharacterized protein LOC107865728 isoform X2 n=1 Tax=Capsicum annuum TaxID=4072 RepID=UPI0007BF798D|nr:uncharacterized protein LOC107865728 isoform X2 [Capsicum annuum]
MSHLHLRATLQILVAISLLSSYAKIEARQSLSEVEDLELERQLKLLNKPAIKTIKGRYGDIYDCVDFYEQPAFDHPLLKNHYFHPEMKPTLPNLVRDDTSSDINRPFNIRLKGGGCPTGTVPIRRTTKDDLIRQGFLSQIRGADDLSPDGDDIKFSITDGTNATRFRGYVRYAIVRIPENSTNKIAGAGAILSVHNPQNLSDHQFSAGYIKVQNDNDSIQAGWIVNPHDYGDAHTRMYTYFKSGKTACFNIRCPGFVQINTGVALDGQLTPSTYGGPVQELPLYIARDTSSGDWWLLVESNNIKVGFWPSKLFANLGGFATGAEYGGVVHSSRGVPEPSMGSGYFPSGDLKKDAYLRNSTYLNENNQAKSLNDIFAELYATSPSLYRVYQYPDSKPENGALVIYGGPGEHM